MPCFSAAAADAADADAAAKIKTCLLFLNWRKKKRMQKTQKKQVKSKLYGIIKNIFKKDLSKFKNAYIVHRF